MQFGNSIVNRLLDSYENSGQFIGNSARKVYLVKSFKLPEIESVEYETLIEELEQLRNKGIIDFSWRTKGYVVDKIWLVAENVRAAYDFVNRKNKHSALERVKSALLKVKENIHDGWIGEYLDGVLEDVSKNKLTGLWNEDEKLIEDVLKALGLIYSLNGGSISMRAASVKLYANSKRFERDIKSYIISIAKKHEPVLKEADEEDISEREILLQLGIVQMSEIFEFCGNLKLHYKAGTVDYSPIKKGACISSDCLGEIDRAELVGVSRVLFIENKTNYTEYCLNSRKEYELVVFHGGLYSPARGKFFRLISKALTSEKAFYWGDIDLGGFNMFCRLRENIFPNLLPFNMDCDCFAHYKNKGLSRSEAYLEKLASARKSDRYSVFLPVIEDILKSGVTVEQEAFFE